MKNYLIGTSFLLGSFAAPSFADDFYLSIGLGQSFVQDVESDTNISGTIYDLEEEFDDAFIYDFEIGKHIENWRLGISYSRSEIDENKITASTGGVGATVSLSPKPTYDVNSFMFNVYRDFPSEGRFTPYVGIGLGTTNIEMQTYTVTVAGTDIAVTDDGRDLFTWDIKGGVSYALNEKTDLYGEVSYFQTDSFDEDGINYDGVKTTNLIAGVKFNF